MALSELTGWILKIIAIMQGGFTVGILTAIIIVALRKRKKVSIYNLYILSVLTGLLLLTFSTLITLWNKLYNVGNLWYWLTLSGYMLCDFSLLILIIKIKQEPKE